MQLRSLFLCLVLMLLSSPALLKAQTQPADASEFMGLQPYQSYHGGAIDSVSLTNGMINLHMPMLSYPQRGKLHLSFDIYYNNEPQHITESCNTAPNGKKTCIWLWGGQPAPLPVGLGGAAVGWAQQMALTGKDTGDVYNSGEKDQYTVYWANWTLWGADGGSHPIGNLGTFTEINDDPVILEQGSGPWRTLDATGWLLYGTFTSSNQTTASATPTAILGPDGVRYALGSSGTMEDPNGNEITAGSSGLTDSLDRSIPWPPTAGSSSNTDTSNCPQPPQVAEPVDHAVLWTVPGPGGSVYYKFCYASFPYNPGPAPLETSGPSPSTQMLLQSIVLPNGTSWSFDYNDPGSGTWDNEPINYATLNQVTLPTGGTISYTYTTINPGIDVCQIGGRWVATRTVNVNDGTGPHTWTYAYTVGNEGSTSTTVTDSLGNYTVHTFTALGNCGSLYETQTQYYRQDGVLLKTVSTSYDYTTGSNNSSSGVTNVVPGSVTTKWQNGQTSETTNSYDSGFNYTDFVGNPGQSGIYGKRLSTSDYDYGSGGPGALLRTTNTSWLALGNASYLNNNLLDLPSSVQINGSSGQESYTAYAYDQDPLQPSGISTQLDASPPDGSYRGNLTSVSRWLNTTNSNLTSTTAYYDTGVVYQAKDPIGNPTSYEYSPAYAGAYPTQITDALGHSRTKTYDFNTGLLTSETDPNNQTTTFGYDSMRRPTQESFPDQGQTTIAYQDSSFPLSATLTRKINPSQDYVTTNVFDGLGRVSQNQVETGDSSCPTIYTVTTYDPLGRKASVSNPYCTTADPTYGLTRYQYDVLNRTTQVTMPDGSVATTSYNGNCATATDEAGKKRESCTDALGRLTTVIEDPGGLGYTTTYGRDALGDLTSVAQDGSRQRSFVYDSLSRLTSATNPETGTVTYAYDADGNLTSKKDARGITTSYSYNQINQLTGETFSNGDASISISYGASSCLGAPACYNVERRTGMTDMAGSESWAYDPMGRVLEDQRTTNSVTKTIGYQYNLDGSIGSVTYPTGRTVAYSYDDAERPTSAVDSAGGINYAKNAAYAPQGALASVLLGESSSFAGITSTADYNNGLQPNEIKASSSAGMAFDLSYNFNLGSGDNGDVMGITDNLDNSRSETFTYDSLNRLASAQTLSTSGSNCWAEQYGYDAWGNLLTIQAPSGYGGCTVENLSVTANANNQVSGLSYDASGDLLSDGVNTYAWNARGEITTAAGLSYGYDGDGRRVEKSQGTIYSYGTASISFSGSEQSKTAPGTHSTGSFTIDGQDIDTPNGWDTGTVSVTVDGYTAQASYGVGSTASSVGEALAQQLNSSGVVTASGGSTVTMTSVATGTGANYPFTVSSQSNMGLNPPSFFCSAGGNTGDNTCNYTMTGGQNGSTIYDSGTVTLTVNGHSDSTNYGQNDTPSTIAANLASAVNGDPSAYVTASASGSTLNLNSVPAGQDYSFSVSITYDSADFSSPSFSASPPSGTLSVAQQFTGTLYWRGPGGQVLDETDLSGNLQNEYVYFDGRRIAWRNSAGNIYYYAGDFLGTTRAIVTSSGSVCYDADFYPYGGERSTTDACPQNYKFTGKERDGETGNDYFGARYYAPQSSLTGRFLSPDWSATAEPVPYAKLGNPQTLNLYAYVADNPTSFADPDGHHLPTPQANQRNKADSVSGGDQTPTAQQQSGAVQSLVDAQNAAMTNPNFAPNTPTAGTTHCNQAACSIDRATGGDPTGVFANAKGVPYDANTQIHNLANSENGYHVVTPTEAQSLANKGVRVWATQLGARHGHIASVRPQGVPGDHPLGRSGPILANVGLFNGVAHQSMVFTPAHGAIVYYAPNQ